MADEVGGFGLDAFEVQRRLITDCRAFTEGFAEVRDERVRAVVDDPDARGAQWPDPGLSLNPSFEPAGRVNDLVRLLQPTCDAIFRAGPLAQDP